MDFQSETEKLEWKRFLRTLNTLSTADRIKMMRNKVNINQEQLGHIAGCTKNTICEIEKGKILNKQSSYLYSICDYFSCSIDWLLYQSNLPVFDPRIEALADYLHLNPDTTDQLISILHNLTESGQERRRGLNHLITADPDAFADLCRAVEEYSHLQMIKDDETPNAFAQYQLGLAWQLIQKIFQASHEKNKELKETRARSLQQNT